MSFQNSVELMVSIDSIYNQQVGTVPNIVCKLVSLVLTVILVRDIVHFHFALETKTC